MINRAAVTSWISESRKTMHVFIKAMNKRRWQLYGEVKKVCKIKEGSILPFWFIPVRILFFPATILYFIRPPFPYSYMNDSIEVHGVNMSLQALSRLASEDQAEYHISRMHVEGMSDELVLERISPKAIHGERMIDTEMAKGLLAIRDALINNQDMNKAINEAYHQLYMISCPGFDILQRWKRPWARLERIAAGDSIAQLTKS